MKKFNKFNNFLITLACFLFIFSFLKFFSFNLLKSNVLSRSQRTSLLFQSSSIHEGRTAKNLIKERKHTAWRSEIDSPFPHVFVFELAGTANISLFKFDNYPENIRYKKVAAKKISAEFSTTSWNSGYTLAGVFNLEISKEIQKFKIQKKKARWIRLSILSNHGNPRLTELSKIEAWGVFNFNPIFITSNFIWVFGAIIILTALSYHEFLAYTKKKKIKDVINGGWHKNIYYLGTIFIIFGFIASIQNIWLYMSLGVVCISFLIWFLKFR